MNARNLLILVSVVGLAALNAQTSFAANAVDVWGANTDVEVTGTATGQACKGNFTQVDYAAPTQTLFPAGSALSINGGAAFVAMAESGTNRLWVCGDNRNGELGIGTNTSIASPVAVTFSAQPIAIAGGWEHLVVLLSNGTVWASGRNSEGELGNGTFRNTNTFVQVRKSTGVLTNAVQIASSETTSFALLSDGTVWAWGEGGLGELGTGSTSDSDYAVKVNFGFFHPPFISKIAAGGYAAYAISGSALYAWGFNGSGQIGDGTRTQRNVPKSVLTGVSQVAPGVNFAVAVGNDGYLWATGDNSYGSFGNGTTMSSLTWMQTVSPIATWVQVVAGHFHVLALDSTGKIRAWGRSNAGQIGDGTHYDRYSPTVVVTGVATSSVLGTGWDDTYLIVR